MRVKTMVELGNARAESIIILTKPYVKRQSHQTTAFVFKDGTW